MQVRKVQTQSEKIIDYQYIRNIKNKEVRKNRFKQTFSQRIMRVVLIFVLVGEAGYLGYEAFLAARASGVFFLNHIEITGTHKTNPEAIRKLVLAEHNNVLLADLTRIKLELENQPWIQSAVIWRELPGTIRIHIAERKPEALVLSSNLYMVDKAGRVIDVFDHDPEYASLPVLTGITEITNEAKVRDALQYVEALSEDAEVLKQVSEIHVDQADATTVYLRGMSFGLLVSKDGILPMIQKFLSISEVVKRNFEGTKVIDLRYQGQVVLKNTYRELL